MGENSNDLQRIITYALNKMKKQQGAAFDINKVNLAEMQRLTGLMYIPTEKTSLHGRLAHP